MLTVVSFCRRVFAPRSTTIILYYLFIILFNLPHVAQKFPKYFFPSPIDKRPCRQYYNVNI